MAGGLLVIALGAGIGTVALSRNAGKAAPPSSPVTTAEVVRTDLVSRTDADGTLGWSHTYTISADQSGRITWLPSVGDTISRGKPVYQVDGHVVPLFYGSTPLWRRLCSGVTKGADVEELESNLKALGYGSGLTVDQYFTDATTTAIKNWQSALGVTQTGVVSPGDVVIEPGDLLISAVKADLGAAAHGPVATATDTTRQVTVNLPVTQQDLAVVGGTVRIKLPGGRTTTGKISSVGTTASAGQDSGSGKAQTGQGTETATIPVYITLDDANAAGKLDGAPVTVGFTSAAHKGVLAVPVSALLANPDGGYAVEAVDSTRRWLVTVQLGIFADGMVEVSGNGLSAGMRVEVPRS